MHLKVLATKTTLKGIPSGMGGVKATLSEMAKIIRAHKSNIDIRELALSIVENQPPKCWTCEAKAIQNYIHKNIRYVRDIDGLETVSTPLKTIQYKQGDCDDMVVLASSLLVSIGHPVRLLAVGFNGSAISHVLLETRIGNNWLPMELTAPLQFGFYPENITSSKIVNLK